MSNTNYGIDANLTVGSVFSVFTSNGDVIGGNVYTSGIFWSNGSAFQSGISGLSSPGNNAVIVNYTAPSTSNVSGALQINGGLGVQGAIYANGIEATPIGDVTASTASFTIVNTGSLEAVAIGDQTPGTGTFTTLSANATAASTNNSNGAFIVPNGGVGITGNLNAGTAGSSIHQLLGNVLIGYGNGPASAVTALEINQNNAAPFNSTSALHVFASQGTSGKITLDSVGSNLSSLFIARTAGGTATSPSAAQSGQTLGAFIARGYGSTGFLLSNALSSTGFVAVAAQNFTDTAQGSKLYFNTVPLNSNVAKNSMWIDSTGNVVIVTNTASNNATSGALIIAGGLGVSGNINTGNAYISNNITVSNAVIFSSSTINAAGSSQLNATAITTDIAYVIGGGGGVALPVATAGRKVSVTNNSGGSIELYPAAGAMIEQLSVNAPMVLPNNTTVEFTAMNSSSWWATTYSYVAGTDISISQTGNAVIAISDTSTLSSVTGRGASTAAAITISNSTASTSTTTGALKVSGGIGVSGNVYTGNIYTGGLYWSSNGNVIQSGISYTANTAPPITGNIPGSQWYDTGSDTLFEYEFDGTNYYWVDITSPIAGGSSLSPTGNIGAAIANSGITYVSANLLPSQTALYGLGTSANKFQDLYLAGNVNASGNIISSGNITANVSTTTTSSVAYSVGYLGVPQNSQASGYTLVIGDAGKHVYVSSTSTVTIPANASVSFPIGTFVTIIAAPSATVTISITSDTMYLAGTGSTGSRSLAPYGLATAIKTGATTWFISGVGLT